MKKLLAAVMAVAAMGAVSSAQAALITQTQTVSLQKTDWDAYLTFNKFDTTLGTLQSVKYSLDGYVQGTAFVENTDSAAHAITTSLTATITLYRPDGTKLVIINPLISQVFNLGAFDGNINFAGASGASTGEVTGATAHESFTTYSSTDFATFSAAGGGSIILHANATGKSMASGSGNMITGFTTNAATDATIVYTYDDGKVPEPASLALLAGGLGLMGAARRRRNK